MNHSDRQLPETPATRGAILRGRYLAFSEEAVRRGLFSLSKVLRALACPERTRALIAARIVTIAAATRTSRKPAA